jgi:tetratricopeptide (TPR) repeat protein
VICDLLHVALNDDSESVAHAAISAASTYFDDEVYRILTAELSLAQDSQRRARVLTTLGGYLTGTRRPPPVKPLGVEFLDTGGLKIELNLGDRVQPLPSEVFRPLIEAAETGDPLCAPIAARAVMKTKEGKVRVGQAANALLDAQNYARMAALADALVDQGPDFTNAFWWRGQARQALGDADGALTDLSTVIQQVPGFARAYLLRGQILCERNDFDNALPDLQRAAELDSQMFGAHYLAAVSLNNLDRHIEAEAAADRAIALAPQMGDAWFHRGIARYAGARPTEALQDIRRAVELNPSDERASRLKADLEAYLGASE